MLDSRDESPRFAQQRPLHISEISPSDVDELADQLERFPNYQTASKVIREAARAFRAQCGAKRSSFSVPDLVAPGDLSLLKAVDLTRLNDVDNLHNLENTMNGVISSANGGAFLSRAKARRSGEANGQKNLVTFHNRFQSHPGLVILDATAGYSPLVQAGKPFQRYSGGTVSYRNLDPFHINQPPEFKLASSRSASSDTIRGYASWVKRTVRAESTIDESVLIVVPKRVRDYLDAMNPIPGRKVKVANWGMGVGSNEYRGCSVIFLFAEFHQPRHIYLARSLAARGLTVSHDELSQANGSHCTGAVSDVSKAHRLRHFKQMASRGSVRLIDERGFANSMRLYTTMDRGLFTESYDSIFPGAAAPSYIDDHSSSQNTKGKRLFGLLASAMAGKRPITLNASDVESETEIASKDLKRVFGSKQCKPLHTRGWRFVPGCGRTAKPVLRYEPVTADVKGFRCVIL
ncbi:hypothetical protein [Salipiger bermudensis]|uniref:hypothetical protein n=1 Tax=Salipiger bermudensis TaxID=344736 RepID=UPI001185DD85|nr:hypothetical protein [Salipiger bermudensis]